MLQLKLVKLNRGFLIQLHNKWGLVVDGDLGLKVVSFLPKLWFLLMVFLPLNFRSLKVFVKVTISHIFFLF